MRWLFIIVLFGCICAAQERDRKFDQVFGIELFTYDYDGLAPREIRYSIDTLEANEIYKRAEFALEFGSAIIVDERHKLVKKKNGKSFLVKGRRERVFCNKGLFGEVCLDGKYEIYFEFYDGGYLIRPMVFKRAGNLSQSVWIKVPFKGPANFYKKDGSLKKQCPDCPKVVESILNRVGHWTYRFVIGGPIPEQE
ncbi:MAG: hypothetical protein HKO67_00315 [Flavobacteriaceae bacterium]|nr:hypothetical protein [Flavobacteriaceae bacterium]